MRRVKPHNPAYQPAGVGSRGLAMLMPLAKGPAAPRDYSGNRYDGTFAGAPAWSDGDFGAQLGSFSGTAYVTTNAYKALTGYPYAFAMLARNSTSGTTTGEGLSVLGGTASSLLWFQAGAANRVQWALHDDAGVAANCDVFNAAVSDGNWHVWMAVSAASNSHSLYLDGVQLATTTTALGTQTFTSMRLGRVYPGTVAAFGLWQGFHPQAKALADDWLTGRFSAFRPPSPLTRWQGMLSPQLVRGTLGAQAQRATVSLGANAGDGGTLAAQAQRASTTLTARRVYTGTVAAQAGAASVSLAGVSVPGLNPAGWWAAPVDGDVFDGVEPDQTSLEN